MSSPAPAVFLCTPLLRFLCSSVYLSWTCGYDRWVGQGVGQGGATWDVCGDLDACTHCTRLLMEVRFVV